MCQLNIKPQKMDPKKQIKQQMTGFIFLTLKTGGQQFKASNAAP